MYIEQIYTHCLAEASYYIESNGEAAIIDPIRETTPYLKLARERGAKIKYIFETHFHADFVSGHIDLAKATGAPIIYGPTAEPEYEVIIAKDKQNFPLGAINLKLLHTPGHTPESSCILLQDERGKDHALFSGDTLFVGDVGRPDLLDGKIDKKTMAGWLYASLTQKIMPLADEVILYPGHGPGSSCGKQIGPETTSTLGIQKKTNYALQPMSREAFMEAVCKDQKTPPQYFFHDALINKKGYESIDEVLKRNNQALSPAEVKSLMEAGVLVLDTRNSLVFGEGHIPAAINIGLDGTYASWIGTLFAPSTRFIVVADPGKCEEAILRLARVGYENVAGYLFEGMPVWEKAGYPVARAESIGAEELKHLYGKPGGISPTQILDVRKVGEHSGGKISGGVQHVCLSNLSAAMTELDKNETWYIHCKSGYRSMIATSLMQSAGFKKVVNIKGGWDAITLTQIELDLPELV